MQQANDIEEIRAQGVLGEFAYRIVFDSADDRDRMRVIYAPNGRGKTNLLRAISYALEPSVDSLQALTETPIESLTIEFHSGAKISIERDSPFRSDYTATATPPPADDTPEVSIDVSPNDFAGRLFRRAWRERQDYLRYEEMVSHFSSGAVLIGDDRLTPTVEEIREIYRGESTSSMPKVKSSGTVKRLLDRVELALTQSALSSISRENEATGVYARITRTTLAGSKEHLSSTQARNALEEKIQDLLTAGMGYERYGLLSLRQLRQISTQLEEARSNDRNLPMLHRILTPFMDSLADQIKSLAPAQQMIDTFVTAVNKFLDRKELRFSTGTGISLHGRDNKLLPPEGLSSGERHLLFLLSHAVLATKDRPLLIIDEPEISLGLDWQRLLLSELLRCSASEQVQFLIASHSVQIMGDLEAGEIIRPTER